MPGAEHIKATKTETATKTIIRSPQFVIATRHMPNEAISPNIIYQQHTSHMARFPRKERQRLGIVSVRISRHTISLLLIYSLVTYIVYRGLIEEPSSRSSTKRPSPSGYKHHSFTKDRFKIKMNGPQRETKKTPAIPSQETTGVILIYELSLSHTLQPLHHREDEHCGNRADRNEYCPEHPER